MINLETVTSFDSTTLLAYKGQNLSALNAISRINIPWIIDSGASDHMTDDYHLFHSYSPCAGNLKVKIADGSLSSVAGKGSIRLSDSISLESVLHVPKLSCNLLSISKLTKDSNCYAKFLPSYCVFQDLSSGKTIGSAKQCEGLYYFDETNGLDPRTTASMFIDARCIGEKKINGEDCFILKLSADPQTLKARSEGLSEIIRHVLFGYFSQKTGLLVHIEDSHLSRIQSNGGDVVYWETTINSFLDDYKSVDGIMIAHSGRSVVSLFRFGELAMSHTRTRMEETWTIDEVAFNIPGLSVDCFILPADLKSNSMGEDCELAKDERDKSGFWSKVGDFDKPIEI